MSLTLTQTDSPIRFDVSFVEAGTLDRDSVIEGWVEKIGDVWQGFTQSGPVGESNSNPVMAAKAVISNYDQRAMLALEQSIANMEKRRDEYPADSALRKGVERLLVGMKSRLADGDF